MARALHESVHKMSWSQAQSVVKVIYLVGDAPPHTDYHDGYDYARAARAAAGKGIQLHTIQCGTDHAAEGAWRQIASLGGGQYMAIHQDGGMQDGALALRRRAGAPARQAGAHRDRLRRRGAGGGGGSDARGCGRAGAVKAARAGFMAKNKQAVGGKGDLVESDRERFGQAGRRPGRPARRHEDDGARRSRPR